MRFFVFLFAFLLLLDSSLKAAESFSESHQPSLRELYHSTENLDVTQSPIMMFHGEESKYGTPVESKETDPRSENESSLSTERDSVDVRQFDREDLSRGDSSGEYVMKVKAEVGTGLHPEIDLRQTSNVDKAREALVLIKKDWGHFSQAIEVAQQELTQEKLESATKRRDVLIPKVIGALMLFRAAHPDEFRELALTCVAKYNDSTIRSACEEEPASVTQSVSVSQAIEKAQFTNAIFDDDGTWITKIMDDVNRLFKLEKEFYKFKGASPVSRDTERIISMFKEALTPKETSKQPSAESSVDEKESAEVLFEKAHEEERRALAFLKEPSSAQEKAQTFHYTDRNNVARRSLVLIFQDEEVTLPEIGENKHLLDVWINQARQVESSYGKAVVSLKQSLGTASSSEVVLLEKRIEVAEIDQALWSIEALWYDASNLAWDEISNYDFEKMERAQKIIEKLAIIQAKCEEQSMKSSVELRASWQRCLDTISYVKGKWDASLSYYQSKEAGSKAFDALDQVKTTPHSEKQHFWESSVPIIESGIKAYAQALEAFEEGQEKTPEPFKKSWDGFIAYLKTERGKLEEALKFDGFISESEENVIENRLRDLQKEAKESDEEKSETLSNSEEKKEEFDGSPVAEHSSSDEAVAPVLKESSDQTISVPALLEWDGLTASQKRSKISQCWSQLKQLEKRPVEKRLLAGAVRDLTPSQWDEVISEAKAIATLWSEIAALYQHDKENPPYWIKSSWLSELNKAEEKKRWWSAKLLYYQAEQGEVRTYAAREQSQHSSNTEAVNWDEAIHSALETAQRWSQVVDAYKEVYYAAAKKARREQEMVLKQMYREATLWYDKLAWYAEQAGKSSDERVVKQLKKRPILYVEPSPRSSLSQRELRMYRGAELINYKEYDDPEGKNSNKIHVRILKTKNSYLRIEEVINPTIGVVLRREMPADHLLVTLKKGVSEEGSLLQLEKEGCVGCSLKLVHEGKEESLYQLFFTPINQKTWEDFWNKIVEEAKKLGLEPEPNFFLESCNSSSVNNPNDPWYQIGKQWSLNDPDYGIKAPQAWHWRTDASSVKVGILDTGLHHSHPDLQANIDEQSSYDVIIGKVLPKDRSGHGTAMAGVIGAIGNNGKGMAGVAWQASMADLKCRSDNGSGNIGNFYTAVQFAIDTDVSILNCSFCFDNSNEKLEKALRAAQKAGIIIVTSAGNVKEESNLNDPLARNHDEIFHYPSSSKWNSDGAIKYDNVVVVAASQQGSNKIANNSFIGPNTIDIAAPGIGILSTTIYSKWDPRPIFWKGYQYGDGTSLAAAHVTGALALLKAHFPADSYTVLINRLLDNADVIAALEGVIVGSRRLNLADALSSAKVKTLKKELSDNESATPTTDNLTPASVSPFPQGEIGVLEYSNSSSEKKNSAEGESKV